MHIENEVIRLMTRGMAKKVSRAARSQCRQYFSVSHGQGGRGIAWVQQSCWSREMTDDGRFRRRSRLRACVSIVSAWWRWWRWEEELAQRFSKQSLAASSSLLCCHLLFGQQQQAHRLNETYISTPFLAVTFCYSTLYIIPSSNAVENVQRTLFHLLQASFLPLGQSPSVNLVS